MENIYYYPETHGLKIFAEVEWPDLDYEFGMLVVWKGKRGGLYYATDDGCSCPLPFEDYTSVAALTPISGKAGLRAFLVVLDSWRGERNGPNIDYVRRKVREYVERRD